MMVDPFDSVPCSRCDGRGTVALPQALQETIDYLRQRGPRSPSRLARVFSTSLNAMINRLEELRRLHLVSRERIERGYEYKPKVCDRWPR